MANAYNITLPADAASVTFVGTKDASTAMVYNVTAGGTLTNGVLAVNAGDTAILNITLTGANSKTRVYTFTVYRP
jgi:hypothetical protein